MITHSKCPTDYCASRLNLSNSHRSSLSDRLNEISHGAVFISVIRASFEPDHLFTVGFDGDSDKSLMVIENADHELGAYVDYGFSPNAEAKPILEVLTPELIDNYASENPNYPFDVWADDDNVGGSPAGREIVAVLREAFGMS